MYVLPVSISLVCVSTIVVALRLFTRIRVVCAPGWDDWFLLLALLTDYAFFGVLIAEHSFGLGKPQATISPTTYRGQLKMLWISVPLYNLSLNLTKVSMILLYMRLFPTKTYRIVLTVVLVFIVCSGIWMVIGTLVVCIPIHSFWDIGVDRTCLSRAVIWYLNAALQIAGDLILVILPMPQLVRLRIPLKQKICLVFIFALGLFVCATSVVRLHFLHLLLNTSDESRINGLAAIWSFIEANVAILCASLPTFRQLLVKIFPRILPSLTRYTYKHNEKSLHGPVMLWEPYRGSVSYSADVSVSADRDSNSHRAEGIQVVSELRWEMGSASGERDSGPLENQHEQANYNRMSDIQFEESAAPAVI
ncbi:hypothetical protein BDW59DRAFT_2855 [Aspergillus cavernicola]|uniref:Rhodopsin domain-containing protein n=1 Tax=Aspergillus cavernicola TaxID=176166 RepID=A0ABR4J4V2_9EURO